MDQPVGMYISSPSPESIQRAQEAIIGIITAYQVSDQVKLAGLKAFKAVCHAQTTITGNTIHMSEKA